MVRDLRDRTRAAKKMQSKAEREAKESATNAERLHEKEVEMLVAEHDSKIIAKNRKHMNEIDVKEKELQASHNCLYN